MPTVSVCIPSYNYGRFLDDAIRSALGQTHADLEVLVVDNGSTDDTPEVAARAAARDPRVRYVRNPENVGAQRNLNRCLELAAGEYVNLLGADDVLEPDAVRALLDAFQRHPGLALAAGARTIVDEGLRPLGRLAFSGRAEVVAGDEAVRRCLAAGNLIGEPSAVLFRRADAARGFDVGYRQLIDAEMWFHLLRRGGFAFVPAPLCKVRRHPSSETSRNVESLSFVSEYLALEAAYDRGGAAARPRLPRGWRMNVALDVWGMQLRGLPAGEAHRTIRRVCPLPVFYALLPYHALRRTAATLRDRWTARALARSPA
jgi:glycosyltransferase involved in cell wall biosynthesis